MNYRISPDVLLQVAQNNNYQSFYKYNSGVAMTKNQFIQKSDNDEILTNTVWNFGYYASRINKVFNSSNLINSDVLESETLRYNALTILLRQGFTWNGLFGILIVVKGMVSGTVYVSRIMTISDFGLNMEISRELIDNDFWVSEVVLDIPRLDNDENLMVSIEGIPYSEVISEGPSIGSITTYPYENFNFEPLIAEAPLPSYIDVSVSIEDTHYVKLEPVTMESNKTLEQSLINYFNLQKKVVPITINHVVKYGNDEDGFKAIRVSNEDSNFNPVSVGLDFRGFSTTTIEIFTSTEFVVNNILLKREHMIVFDYSDIINPLLQNIIVKDTDITVFPVTIKKETVINQNVIQQDTETKIVTILQPIFAEIVTTDITFENKVITFSDINIESYMVITDSKSKELSYVRSLITTDFKICFDLSTVAKPTKDSEFQIFNSKTNTLTKRGSFVN